MAANALPSAPLTEDWLNLAKLKQADCSVVVARERAKQGKMDEARQLLNEALSLVRPDLIEAIHHEYLDAGADILETNTFNAQAISMADFDMQQPAPIREMNVAAAHIARKAADDVTQRDPSKPRYVAGALGPMNRTLSLSPDVNNPGFRAVNFDGVMQAYYDQAAALLEGGVDVLLAETTFDTLNLKAALYAIQKLFAEGGRRVPVMASVTITDQSGRTLSPLNPSNRVVHVFYFPYPEASNQIGRAHV